MFVENRGLWPFPHCFWCHEHVDSQCFVSRKEASCIISSPPQWDVARYGDHCADSKNTWIFMCISPQSCLHQHMCYSKKKALPPIYASIKMLINEFRCFLQKKNRNIILSNIVLWVASCYYISGYIMSGSHQLTRCTVYTITCWLWGSNTS